MPKRPRPKPFSIATNEGGFSGAPRVAFSGRGALALRAMVREREEFPLPALAVSFLCHQAGSLTLFTPSLPLSAAEGTPPKVSRPGS